MKKFKRALSLVLVIGICLSLVMFTGAATAANVGKYTDFANIKNKAAVDVLTHLEIVNGFPDGSYGYNTNLTRSQGAAIMARIMTAPLLGGTTTRESILAGFKDIGAQFSDVLAISWYSGEIGYGVEKGYFVGMGDGSFAPDATLSKAAAAKLLLVALGFDAKIEQFEGTNWSANVMNLAFQVGLFDGVDASNPHGAVNRDDYAQMILNALLARMVGYVVVRSSDGSYETLSIYELTDLAAKYSLVHWQSGQQGAGKHAIKFYYNKDVVVNDAIVIANGYTALGDKNTFTSPTSVGVHMDNGSTDKNYDPYKQTVVLYPKGVCAHTGSCIGPHNIGNINCPANIQAANELDVLACQTGINEIGRAVKAYKISNLTNDPGALETYFAGVVLKDINKAETTAANGKVNDNVSVKLTKDITKYFEFFSGDVDDYKGTTKDKTSATFGAVTNANDYIGPKYYDFALQQLITRQFGKGYVETVISNDGNHANAEFAYNIEKVLAEVKTIGTDGTVGVVTLVGTDTIKATGLSVNDVILYYKDLVGNVYVDVLAARTGTLNSVTGNGNTVFTLYNGLEFLNYTSVGIREGGSNNSYDISELTTRDINAIKRINLNKDVIFYLDNGGNVVKIDEVDRFSSIKGFVYGYVQQGATFLQNQQSILKVMKKDGTVLNLNVAPDGVKPPEWVTDGNPFGVWTLYGETVVNHLLNAGEKTGYATVYLYDGEVYAVRFETIDKTTIGTGSLVIGTEFAVTPLWQANTSTPYAPLVAPGGYVNDATVFFYLSTPTTSVPNNYATQTVTRGTGINSFSKTHLDYHQDIFQVIGVDIAAADYIAEIVSIDMGTKAYNAIEPVENATNSRNKYNAYVVIDEYSFENHTTISNPVGLGSYTEVYTIETIYPGTPITLSIPWTLLTATVELVEGVAVFGVNYNMDGYVSEIIPLLGSGYIPGSTGEWFEGVVRSKSVETDRIAVRFNTIGSLPNLSTTYSYDDALIIEVYGNQARVGSGASLSVGSDILYIRSSNVKYAAHALDIIFVIN